MKRVKQHPSLAVGEGKALLFDQAAAEGEDGNQDLGGGAPRRGETRAGWLAREILPHEPLVRSTLRRAFPTIDADDVIQATYLRLLAAAEVDHIKDARGYFYRTARSVILDRQRRDRVVEFESVDFDTLDWAADEPSVESIIDSRRALERFYDALRDLPPRQQEVIYLRRIEGLRAKAIADRLALSVSSIEKLQGNAMRRLNAAMARL